MPRVWCAAIECEHNKGNQCLADEINLSNGHVHTYHQGFMEYWKCRTYTESEEFAKLRGIFDAEILQMHTVQRQQTATQLAERSEYIRKSLSKPVETPSCYDCAYCDRGAYLRGKWPCRNPQNRPGESVGIGLPCFVRRGSKEAHDRGL